MFPILNLREPISMAILTAFFEIQLLEHPVIQDMGNVVDTELEAGRKEF